MPTALCPCFAFPFLGSMCVTGAIKTVSCCRVKKWTPTTWNYLNHSTVDPALMWNTISQFVMQRGRRCRHQASPKKRKKEVVCIEKVEAGCTHHSGVAATRRKIDKILHNDKRTYLILDALIPFSIPKLKQKVVFYPQCICTVEICSWVPGLLSVWKALPRLKQLLEEREKPHIAASHKTLQ